MPTTSPFAELIITPAPLLAPPLYVLAAVHTLALLYYLATVLQMSAYKPSRALFHFPRPRWHLRGFLAPFALFMLSCASGHLAAVCAVVAGYICALAIWARGLDRRLVFTPRIKRLFAYGVAFCALFGYLHFRARIDAHLLDSLAAALAASYASEWLIFRKYLRQARAKIAASNAQIVLITASFGKTSIKHHLAQLLGERAYFAPGSINTLAGLARDINDNFAARCPEIYIAEAGARQPGDIAQITALLQPQTVIIGQIGGAHLEYFGDISRTKATKREALTSARLERVFMHSSASEPGDKQRFGAAIYDEAISDVRADLEGTSWQLGGERLHAPVLGAHTAQNATAALLAARALGATTADLSALRAVAHRLQVIMREPKFIIDDGFNANLAGVLASYELAAQHPARRVLVTPGLLECAREDNETAAAAAAQVFDVIIIAARTNAAVWQQTLQRAQASARVSDVVILPSKDALQSTLAQKTQPGDLVLFSNDAPNDM